MPAAKQDEIFGEPYASGVKANRRTIQRLLDGAIEQGLIRKPIRLGGVLPGRGAQHQAAARRFLGNSGEPAGDGFP